jgi:hypothetical protein
MEIRGRNGSGQAVGSTPTVIARVHDGTRVPSQLSPVLIGSSTECCLNTYGECDARCSASHLSLIQPSVLGFTPPGTRILRMTTAAINTMTAPTISSIWFSTWRHRGHRTHCIGGPYCALFAIAQRMTWRGACTSAAEGHACVALVPVVRFRTSLIRHSCYADVDVM